LWLRGIDFSVSRQRALANFLPSARLSPEKSPDGISQNISRLNARCGLFEDRKVVWV